jgi:hypothetical protein
MKTFTLPVSDCGCFVAGELNESKLSAEIMDQGDPPRYGVVIWYRDKDVAREAVIAASQAHWPE